MSKLYIQIENNAPINHPAFEENLISAFGKVPENWEPFSRIEFQEVGTFQVLEFPSPPYKKVNGVWTDAWYLREMTVEEKEEKQRIIDEAVALIRKEILPTIPVTTI
jgi:hypothetical protein